MSAAHATCTATHWLVRGRCLLLALTACAGSLRTAAPLPRDPIAPAPRCADRAPPAWRNVSLDIALDARWLPSASGATVRPQLAAISRPSPAARRLASLAPIDAALLPAGFAPRTYLHVVLQ